MRHTKIFTASILMALSLAFMPGCQKGEESSGAMSETVLDVAVETSLVTTTSFTRTRAYVGNVSAAKQVKVIPLATERILEFPWENGDFVEKDAVIAVIRNEVSKKGLEAFNAQIRSVDAQLKAAERELARVKSMYESNIVSRQQYDQASDGVTTLQATKQQLLATQEQTKLSLNYAKVIAPISGVISNKGAEVGDIASSAMPLCILNDMETLKVTLNVNEEDTPYLKLGKEVKLRFDAYPGEEFTAHITRILPYVNASSRTNTVEAEFKNERMVSTNQYKFKPGMYSRAELSLETTNDAIVIPPKAAILDPELLSKQKMGQTLRRVFILQPDMTAKAVDIEVGEYSGNVLEVLSGLNPGDRLIIRGQHALKDGDKVHEVQKTGNAAVAKTLPAPAMPDPAPVAAELVPAAPADGAPAADAAPAAAAAVVEPAAEPAAAPVEGS